MSRRYGRQQKRQAKAKIAVMEDKLRDYSKKEGYWKRKCSETENDFQTMAQEIERVCRNSTALPVKSILVDRPAPCTYDIALIEPVDFCVDHEIGPVEHAYVDRISLHRVMLKIEEDASMFGKRLHLKIGDNLGDYWYYISEEMYREHGIPIRHMVEMFANEIRKHELNNA